MHRSLEGKGRTVGTRVDPQRMCRQWRPHHAKPLDQIVAMSAAEEKGIIGYKSINIHTSLPCLCNRFLCLRRFGKRLDTWRRHVCMYCTSTYHSGKYHRRSSRRNFLTLKSLRNENILSLQLMKTERIELSSEARKNKMLRVWLVWGRCVSATTSATFSLDNWPLKGEIANKLLSSHVWGLL